LKDTGVSITALMPDPTETNFFQRAGMEDTKVGISEKDDPSDVAKTEFEALMAGDDHVVAGSSGTRCKPPWDTFCPIRSPQSSKPWAAHGGMEWETS
jgi:hypothetical protein